MLIPRLKNQHLPLEPLLRPVPLPPWGLGLHRCGLPPVRVLGSQRGWCCPQSARGAGAMELRTKGFPIAGPSATSISKTNLASAEYLGVKGVGVVQSSSYSSTHFPMKGWDLRGPWLPHSLLGCVLFCPHLPSSIHSQEPEFQ